VRTLLGGLADELVADDRTHEALATKAVDLLARRSDLSELCVESTARFDLARTSARLEALYSEVLSLARREGDLVS
jgi:hypothetical protein